MKKTKSLVMVWVLSAVLFLGACEKNAETENTRKYYLTDENGKDIPQDGKPTEEEISVDTLYVLAKEIVVFGNANGSTNAVKARVINKNNGEEYIIKEGQSSLLAFSERGDEIVVRTFMKPEEYMWGGKGVYYRMQKHTETIENITTERLKKNLLKQQMNGKRR